MEHIRILKEVDAGNLLHILDHDLEEIGPRDLYVTPSALISRCFVNIDKPRGPSSHEVAAWVGKMAGAAKVGHGGTLEPLAEKPPRKRCPNSHP